MGENKYSSPTIDGGARLSDGEKAGILDWVTACQSAYHIDSTPGHPFGGLGSDLEENRNALIDCIESAIAQRAALSVSAASAGKPVHQWRTHFGDDVWQDVPAEGFENIGRLFRRIVYTAPPVTAKGEPAAWLCTCPQEDGEVPGSFTTQIEAITGEYEAQGWTKTPLYAAPPVGSGQSLTDERIREIARNFWRSGNPAYVGPSFDEIGFARALLAHNNKD